MKKMSGIIAIFITMPIWFYIVHWLLKQSNAGELQWFLFWIYVPATLIVHIAARVAADD
jgi:hypothetical protein